MKKSLILLLLAILADVAAAQSSVTMYGTIDLNGRYIKNDGSTRRLSMGQDGLNNSQLVFTGREDLGSGLYAGFTLNAGVNADTGSANTKFFNRRATFSLGGKLGEIRLGRDYTPSFWNNGYYDAFGIVGIAASGNVIQLPTTTLVRADNSIGYILPPSLGPLYGQAMVAAAELGAPGNNGRYIGARLGYKTGAWDIAVSAAEQRNAVGFPVLGNTQKTYNLGGSYDFGIVKLLGYVDRDVASDRHETRGSVSAIVPFDQSEIHIGYDRSKLQNDATPASPYSNVVWQAKVGYVYNLSKRTAMYGTAATLKNGDRSSLAIAAGSSITAAPIPAGTSKGIELGIRHFF